MDVHAELRFGRFILDRANQILLRGHERIDLPRKAFNVLFYLAERPGKLVTKNELLDAVWGDSHVTEGVLKRCIVEIRKVLNDPAGEPKYIQTLHGRGYRFLAQRDPERTSQSEQRPAAVVVGRDFEFANLNDCFDTASRGVRQVVFIAGEAGLGKTTLLDSWLRSLASREAETVRPAIGRGRCLQQFGSGEPYLPMFEALSYLSRSISPQLVWALRKHAPTWLMHLPALISVEDRVQLRDEVFGTTRERMLREVTDALEALSSVIPIVLAFEDLHWSDPSTIDLLTSIATRDSAAHLMILATYRQSEIGSTAPLARMQHELEIHHQCRVLPLAYLSEVDIQHYLALRFPEHDFRGALVKPLRKRTSGNPLFVTCLVDEMVRLGSTDPDRIPQGVPQTLQKIFEYQAAQLAESEREIVETAAVEGELFATATLAAALRRDTADVEACCEALVNRHLILKRAEPVRFPDGTESSRYVFHHVLCRDALYHHLAPARRQRLHAELGRAMEQAYTADPDSIAAELAGHFELGGRLSEAIQYLRRAADAAAARYAVREAVNHLERALRLNQRRPSAEYPELQMDLLEQRALVRISMPDLEGAAADLEAVYAEADRTGNVNRKVRALLDSVMPLGFVDHPRSLMKVEEAGKLRSQADPILAALADTFRAGTRAYHAGWSQEVEDLMNEALLTLNPVKDPAMRFRFLWMEAFVRNSASNFAECRRAAEECRSCARTVGSFHQYFLAVHNSTTSLIYQGNLGEAMRRARADSVLAATNHHLLEQLIFESYQAMVAIEAFDFDFALPICERVAREPIMMRYPLLHYILLWLGLAQLGKGSLAEAEETLERFRKTTLGSGVGFEHRFPLLQAQASCALAHGNLARAKEFALRNLELAEKHRVAGHTARGYRLLSEIATRHGDPAGATAHALSAVAAVRPGETLNVEWQVYATAANALGAEGRMAESDQARAHAERTGAQVAATLVGETRLQRSLETRIKGQLASRASA